MNCLFLATSIVVQPTHAHHGKKFGVNLQQLWMLIIVVFVLVHIKRTLTQGGIGCSATVSDGCMKIVMMMKTLIVVVNYALFVNNNVEMYYMNTSFVASKK